MSGPGDADGDDLERDLESADTAPTNVAREEPTSRDANRASNLAAGFWLFADVGQATSERPL